MRPVNLIPADQRRGEAAPARAGVASYIVVAALFAILFAVTGVVLTNNSVDQKKSELASLEAQQTEAEARAAALSNFASFQRMKDNRVLTISSLAQSRFDWERVMREVALVLPDHVWLTNLTGTVAPGVEVPKSATVTSRTNVAGPALTMVGCARSQDDVAALIAAVGDIDGVTRVLVEKSEKSDIESPTSVQGDAASEGDCRTRSSIAQFALVAAFDEVVAPAGSGDAAAAAAAAAPASTTPAAPTPTAGGTTTTGAAVVPEEQQQKQDVEGGIEKANKTAGLIGAGDGG